MKVVHADLWSSKANLIAVTCNGFIAGGHLVMGRGAALEAKSRLPECDTRAAEAVRIHGTLVRPGIRVYGFVRLEYPDLDRMGKIHRLGLFQVKYHFKDKADPYLIAYSAMRAKLWLKNHPDQSLACNYPGVGYGQLATEDVQPVLDAIFDKTDKITFYVKEG